MVASSGDMQHASWTQPLGDADPALLADVIAFLDGFDEMRGGDSWLPRPPISPTAVSGVIESVNSTTTRRAVVPTCAREAKSPSVSRRQSAVSAKNRARVDRYQKRRQELQSLRGQVATLTEQLERLQQRANSTLEARATSTLGITIRSAYRGAVDWERRAEQERQMRHHAEQTNAQLRQVLRSQQQWNSTFESWLRQISGSSIRVHALQVVSVTLNANRLLTTLRNSAICSTVLPQDKVQTRWILGLLSCAECIMRRASWRLLVVVPAPRILAFRGRKRSFHQVLSGQLPIPSQSGIQEALGEFGGIHFSKCVPIRDQASRI